MRRFDRRGTPLGERILAHTPSGFDPLYGVNTLPVGIDLWIVRILLDGEPLTPRRLTQGPVDVLGDLGWSMAVAPDGSLFVTWGEDVIRAWRFAPDVTPLGEPFVVSDAATQETSPRILPLADRTFLAVWNDRGGRDGDGDGVFARLFAFDGTPLSRVFRVNRTTAGSQNEGFPAVGRRGPVIVAWASEDVGSEQGQIVLRLLPVGN